ncbi:MAG: FkbM family methyltransferase [Paracoccaceae bacterium]
MIRRAAEKLTQIGQLLSHATTPWPLILDSLRLQKALYDVRLKDGTVFRLMPRQGDWFTVYEGNIRKDYLQHGIRLGYGDVVVDIGANFGAFSVLASQIVGETGHVYAFEPNPETHARLTETIRTNDCTNVTIFNEAVGPADGTSDFFIFEKSAYASLHQGLDARTDVEAQRVTVASRTISAVLAETGRDISLMKIDCEGGEYAIFDALTAEDMARIPQITMEMHHLLGRSPAELREKLAAFGYVLHGDNPLAALHG